MRSFLAAGRWRQPGGLEQFGYQAARTLRAVATSPTALVLAIAFPILFLAINIEALGGAAELPGFPTDNLADFAIGLAYLQGALFAAVTFSTDLAEDIERGITSRIALAPVSAANVLLARLAAVVGFALVQVACFLLAGTIAGATLSAGPDELVVLVFVGVLINVAVSVLGFQLALYSGSAEVTQSLFPIFFVLLLMSSALMPRELMDIDWYRTIADLNPVSYMDEAVRSLYMTGWDAEALLIGIGVALAIAVLGTLASAVKLRSLLARHR